MVMPVLLKSENMPPQVKIDLDSLVVDLKERLCLKNKDRGCPRRSSPYQNRRHANCMSETCCASASSHFNVNSPKPKEYLHKLCHRKSRVSKIKYDMSEDPRALLDKLIREQSLIQEAVRRVQFQFSQNEVPSTTKSELATGFLVDTYISSSDNEDSTGQFHYSGSSDVSRHSIN